MASHGNGKLRNVAFSVPGQLAFALIIVAVSSSTMLAQPLNIQGGKDDQQAIEAAIESWGRLHKSFHSGTYLIEATSTIPKESQSDLEGNRFPINDHTFVQRVKYVIDFENNRMRREGIRETYNLSLKTFQPEVLYDLFDGNKFQQYLPRDMNIQAGNDNWHEFQSELVLRGEIRSAAFIRAIDTPLFWSHGLLPILYVKPETLTVEHNAEMFSYQGARDTDLGSVHMVQFQVPGQPGRHWEYWLSEESSWLPIRRSKFINNNESSRLTVEYQTSNNSTPIASKWTLITFSGSKGDGNTIAGIDECVLKSYELDTDLTHTQFQVVPSPGVIIKDVEAGTRVVKGALGQPDAPVEQAAADRMRGRTSWLRGIMAAGSMLCLAVLIYFVWRKDK